MAKLLIVSASSRVLREPEEPVEALKRFDGVFARMIRRYYGSRKRGLDILILSPAYGLIWADQKIPYKEPIGGSWHRLSLTKDQIDILRGANLSNLRKVLSASKYDEIHVNLGQYLLQLVEGFEEFVDDRTKITYATGKNLGQKIRSLKDWLKSQNRH